MIRVALPLQLRELARLEGDLEVDVPPPASVRAVLDEIERRYPSLLGTIRDEATGQRRAFLRFFVCNEDWSMESPDAPLPAAVASGVEPLLIVGAVSGG
ncbi:MAG: MoaD/ThiS family protein [Planctomycetales bacterium]|nr:MoaD/ThiS family protein [Planctomycetales bacterium]